MHKGFACSLLLFLRTWDPVLPQRMHSVLEICRLTSSVPSRKRYVLDTFQDADDVISAWQVMRDPVVASDGHTYEREAIEAWLRRDHRKSPMTNETLSSTALVPNHNLRSQIGSWT
jgi:hypothetical protein